MLAPSELAIGKVLPGFEREVQQLQINRYAEASGDHNPIHTDTEFARRTPLGGTIAHGMLILAYASEMLTSAFGNAYTAHGGLEARFKNPARPGDTIRVGGSVTKLEATPDGLVVTCHFSCQNQDADPVVVGEATARYECVSP